MSATCSDKRTTTPARAPIVGPRRRLRGSAPRGTEQRGARLAAEPGAVRAALWSGPATAQRVRRQCIAFATQSPPATAKPAAARSAPRGSRTTRQPTPTTTNAAGQSQETRRSCARPICLCAQIGGLEPSGRLVGRPGCDRHSPMSVPAGGGGARHSQRSNTALPHRRVDASAGSCGIAQLTAPSSRPGIERQVRRCRRSKTDDGNLGVCHAGRRHG